MTQACTGALVRVNLLLAAFVAVDGAALTAQGRVKAQSCVAADTLLGPLTPRQQKMSVSAGYYRGIDSSTYFSGWSGDASFSATGTLPGRGVVQVRPSGRLRVMVPEFLTEQRDAAATPVIALVNDSTAMILPPPPINGWIGNMRPRNMPIHVAMTPAQFLAIARAETVQITWFKEKIKASPDDLAAINVMYRLMLCLAVPDAR